MGWFGPAGDCGCCDGGGGGETVCDILVDDFNRSDTGSLGSDWTEVSGTWGIASNEAEASSNDSIAVSVAEKGVGTGSYSVSANLIGDKTKLIFDYVDSSNYYDVIFNSGTSLVIRKTTAGSTANVKTESVSTTDSIFIKVCVIRENDTQSNITVNYGGTPTIFVEDSAIMHGGEHAGIGTDTISADVQFDNFSYQRYSDETNDTCDECTTFTCTCCDSVPAAIILDLTGVSLTDVNCEDSGFCEGITGKYTLSSGGGCGWRYRQNTECCPDDPVATSFSMFLGISSNNPLGCRFELDIDFNVAQTDPDCTVDCLGDCPGSEFVKYRSLGTFPLNSCSDFGTVTLTKYSDGTGDHCSANWPTTVVIESL